MLRSTNNVLLISVIILCWTVGPVLCMLPAVLEETLFSSPFPLTASITSTGTQVLFCEQSMVWFRPRQNVIVLQTRGFLKQPMLYCSNSSSLYHPHRLVTLSNDVQENPGPVLNSCASCDRPVAKNHRYVQCNPCF